MPDPFQPVFPGAPKSPMSARTFNGLMRAGQSHARSKFGDGGGGQDSSPLVPACECQIHNLTGADLPQGSILAIGSAVVNPAVHPLAAQESPTFTGAAVADVTLPFVITSGPIPNNAIGDAVTAGFAVCTVSVSDAAHTRAKPAVGVTANLVSDDDEGVPIVWKESGTGSKKAIVLMGGGSDPDASLTVRGYVSTGAQSFNGLKTFQDGVKAGDGTVGCNPSITFAPNGGLGLSIRGNADGSYDFISGSGIGRLNLIGIEFAINDGTQHVGMTTSFLTGDGRTATFTGGILTGLA